MANPYEINYNDKRFTDVEAEKDVALKENAQVYDGMINQTDSFYNAQIDATKDWEKKQTEIQNEQTDFAIEKIEQQKAQAEKDYTKEQSGAYVDYKKQSNQYGANAEAMAAQGMANTGYSESSQVSMYNTYQNRVATARESFSRAVLNYDNAMKDARLQNSAALAQIAYDSLQKQLELSLQGFQYKNQLVLDKANKKLEIDNIYYSRYQDVLQQINTENSLAENIRQFNANLAESKRQHQESLAMQQAQLDEQQRQFDEEMAWAKEKWDAENTVTEDQEPTGGGGGGGSGSGGSSGGSGGSSGGSGKIKKNNTTYSSKNLPAANGKAVNRDDELEIDMKSVLALGYGPISEAKLNELVKSGKVVEKVVGNKIVFEKAKTKSKYASSAYRAYADKIKKSDESDGG